MASTLKGAHEKPPEVTERHSVDIRQAICSGATTVVIDPKRAEQIVSRVHGEYVDWLPLDRAVEQLRDEYEVLRAAGVTNAELLELAYITVWRVLNECALVMPGAKQTLVDALCLAYGVTVEYRPRTGQHLEFRLIPLPRDAGE